MSGARLAECRRGAWFRRFSRRSSRRQNPTATSARPVRLFATLLVLVTAAGARRLVLVPDHAAGCGPATQAKPSSGSLADGLIAHRHPDHTWYYRLSLLFESIHFFRIYPASGLLLLGDLESAVPRRFGRSASCRSCGARFYVSFVALALAVPLGLMIAIYLAEYAGSSLRSFAKPAIEMLAGIPTIVYGLFALITVGPLHSRLDRPADSDWAAPRHRS